MSKRTQIDKIEGEPFLENHYNLWSGGKLVAKDVPFETLAAAPELLTLAERISAAFPNCDCRPGIEKYHQCLGCDARATIAKATGGEE